jgi:hypothetical protein
VAALHLYAQQELLAVRAALVASEISVLQANLWERKVA